MPRWLVSSERRTESGVEFRHDLEILKAPFSVMSGREAEDLVVVLRFALPCAFGERLATYIGMK